MTDILPNMYIPPVLGNKYHVGAKLGRGGIGNVYKAYQPNLDRHVAIKMLSALIERDSTFIQRFQQEATAVARLRHDNIVHIYDFDAENELFYIVMELIEGPTLQQKLLTERQLNKEFILTEVINLFLILVEAIGYAHAQGVIHRDLKPANIMFTASGKSVLTDFGMAYMTGNTSDEENSIIQGTPAYMSPEQCRGERGDERSDLYALGLILYEMLTGRRPFTANQPYEYLAKHLHDPVPLPSTFNSDLPHQLESFLLKILEKEPANRYQSASEMLAALQQIEDSTANFDQPLPAYAPPFDVGSAANRLNQVRLILQECIEHFGSDDELRTLFADKRLRPWQFELPHSNSLNGRIDNTISYLSDKYNAAGENAIVLLLRVLSGKYHPDDSRPSRLIQLAAALEESSIANQRVSVDSWDSSPSQVGQITERQSTSSTISGPFQAPRQEAQFVGRTADINWIRQKIAEGNPTQIICLVGMGGIGKSTLAKELAHILRPDFPDGVLWTDISRKQPQEIIDSWAAAYGFDYSNLPNVSERAIAIRSDLADKKGLMILDDVKEATEIENLLPSGHHWVVIITTRFQELSFDIGADEVKLEPLEISDSYQLLLKLVGEKRVSAEREAALKIGRRLEHMPLALQLIAGRLRKNERLNLNHLAERLQEPTGIISELDRRGYKMRQSIDLSWDYLDPPLQQLFAFMGVFEGRPFRVSALMAVSQLNRRDTEDGLFELAALSLVAADGDHHYRQHPLLADYAHEKLDNNEYAYARMSQYYFDYAQEYHAQYDALEPEWGNFRAAMDVSYKQERWQQLIDFTRVLTDAWFGFGHFSDARHAFELAYQAAEKLNNPMVKANNLCRWGEAALKQGDFPEAEKHLSDSLHIFQEFKEQKSIAHVQYLLGHLYQNWGKTEQALEWLNLGLETIDIYGQDESEGLTIKANLLVTRCAAYGTQFKLDEAERDGRDAREIAQRLGNKEVEASVWNLLGSNEGDKGMMVQSKDESLAQDHFNLALDYHKTSLALREALKKEYDIAQSLENIAIVLTLLGKMEEAIPSYRKALEIKERMGDIRSVASLHSNLGMAYLLSGDLDSAEQELQRALAIWQQLGHQAGAIFVHHDLGNLYLEKGQLDEAKNHLEIAVQLYEEFHIEPYLFDAVKALAEVYLAMQDTEAATAMAQKALQKAQQEGNESKEKRAMDLLEKIQLG